MEIIKISLILLRTERLRFRQLVQRDPRVLNLTCGVSLLQGRPLLEASQEIKAHFRHQTLSDDQVFMKAKD